MPATNGFTVSHQAAARATMDTLKLGANGNATDQHSNKYVKYIKDDESFDYDNLIIQLCE